MPSVLFVDSRVQDIDTLLAGLDDGVCAIVLDAGLDGIEQMLHALRDTTYLDAIHIVSHGASGIVQLGSSLLTEGSLDNHRVQLAQIGAALSADGDILLYGCNVAGGNAGVSFVEALALLTGADVAASTDDTGRATVGGDWVLEVSTGQVEVGIPFDPGTTHLDALNFDNLTEIVGDSIAIIGDGPPVIIDVSPTLSIAAASADKPEGNGGATPFTFTVTRSGNISGSILVNWAVSDGESPSADSADFAGGVFPSGALSFAANELIKTVTVNVAGDRVYESGGASEQFNVVLFDASEEVIITTPSATGYIQDDDAARLSITATNADNAEGNGGTTPFTFTVRRSGDLTGSLAIDWAVAASSSGPSADAADFSGGIFPTGSVHFAAGDTTKTVTVNVAGDTLYENEGVAERFTVNLSNPSVGAVIAGSSATGYIQNDDDAPTRLAIAAASADKLEGNAGTTPFTFTVTRSGILTGSTAVNWAVEASSVSPSADAIDFAASGLFPNGSLVFAPNETIKTITLNVTSDTLYEGGGLAENFLVLLSNASFGTSITTGTAAGTIRNDDGGAGSDTVIGSDSDDSLDGGDGDDAVIGEAGNDSLGGGSGNDTLRGGPGDDTLIGGPGNDTADYSDAPGPVTIDLAAGRATGAAGNDTLIGIENAIGSDFADTLIGSDGANVLDGRGGADTMRSGFGNDTYHVDELGDQVIEAPNALAVSSFAAGLAGTEPVPLANALEGFIDTVIAAISYSLENVADVENLLLAAASAAAAGTGSELDNALTGNELNNTLSGLAGNDQLAGLGGNDTLDGGAGVDTAAYTGTRAEYVIGVPGPTVSGPEGNDTLTNIERLQFADRSVAFDLALGEAAGNTVRVIGAALGAQYNGVSAFVGIGIDLFEAGVSVLDACGAALASPLYLSTAGSSSNEAFVTTVYRNVVGVLPSPAELNYFVGLLQGSGGSMTQAQLLEIAATIDLNAVNINLVGLQQTGIEFV